MMSYSHYLLALSMCARKYIEKDQRRLDELRKRIVLTLPPQLPMRAVRTL